MYKGLAALVVAIAATAVPCSAQSVYLNNTNSTVALGASMAPNPFANRTTAASLASIIDAASATASEFHNQSTHVWVSNGVLELDFDFLAEYDLNMLHFWNYHSEGFDVDNINFSFYDENKDLVGVLMNVTPALGGSAQNDATPIFAQNYALAFPTKVRYVNAVLSGSNGQVDFNNMGFTGTLAAANTPVPEPSSVLLTMAGLGALFLRRRFARA
jgi:PEP-CTERM motif